MLLIVNYFSKYSASGRTRLPVTIADDADLSIESIKVTLREAFKIPPNVNVRINMGAKYVAMRKLLLTTTSGTKVP
jgi:hypothetical protein